MAKRSSHYTKADMFYRNVAYCDQWAKIMAVYDECDNLRAVVKEDTESNVCNYKVLLIGDDKAELYQFNDFELGSTGKNMEACFRIYCGLNKGNRIPTYMPSFRKTVGIDLSEIFPHTRVGARRTGGFHVIHEDVSDKIIAALERYYKETNTCGDPIDCMDYGCAGSWSDTIIGEGGMKMYHIGGGVYCDDDGDNWDFF